MCFQEESEQALLGSERKPRLPARKQLHCPSMGDLCALMAGKRGEVEEAGDVSTNNFAQIT